MEATMQVGVIGLGAMGSAMANNLLKAGFTLRVYNRSPAKAEVAQATWSSPCSPTMPRSRVLSSTPTAYSARSAPPQFFDVVRGTLFAPIYKTCGGLIAEERHHPAGFKAELGYKDIRLALAATEALKVPMPLASLIATRRLALIAQGGGHLDWSAMAKLAARDAGLATTPHSSQ